jgi:hypothetical protein
MIETITTVEEATTNLRQILDNAGFILRLEQQWVVREVYSSPNFVITEHYEWRRIPICYERDILK